jgi:hypothetical protein
MKSAVHELLRQYYAVESQFQQGAVTSWTVVSIGSINLLYLS